MKKYTSIIFDFGGVLGSDANSWTNDADVLEKTGLSSDEITRLFLYHWRHLKVGEEDLQTFFEDIAKRSNKPIAVSLLRDLYHRNIVINREILDLVKQLDQDYALYILANESLEGMNVKKEKFDLHNYFLEIFNSAELGVSKPDQKLFFTVLKKINTSADRVLFIDDQEKNINAAQKLGIKSVLFTGSKQLQEELITLL